MIDLGSGIAVVSVGHAAPAVVEAVRDQIAKFAHTCFMVSPYEQYVAVCEELNARTPGDHEKRSALFNSGAEAVENAVKIARHVTGRDAVIVFDHAYHGRTNLTMALTAKNMPYRHRFGPFAPEVYRVPMSYPFRDPEGMTGVEAAARAIEQMERQVGAGNAALRPHRADPGRGWLHRPRPRFPSGHRRMVHGQRCPAHRRRDPDRVLPHRRLVRLRRRGCRPRPHHDGQGHGRWHAARGRHGAGRPHGPGARRRARRDLRRQPGVLRAALASIKTMVDQDLAGAAAKIGATIADRFTALQHTHPGIGDVRGRGAMMAMELVRPGTHEPDADAAKRIVAACQRQGVVTLSCGSFGNVLRLLPPLVIEPGLLDDGLGILADAITAEL